MIARTDDGDTNLAVRVRRLLIALLASVFAVAPAAAQGSNDSKDEVFEVVDPYTGGEAAGLARAGYSGMGPFPLWEAVRTTDVEEVIGRRVLWIETAHFKIGSTLETYKVSKGDAREEKRLKEELKRLEPRFAKFKRPGGKLDPWLRLHLYGLRIEEQYAAFLQTFALTAADFPGPDEDVAADDPRGRGPYLGQARKAVVLLLEKQSHFGRVTQRWYQPVVQQSTRQRMPGGGMLLITCAETLAGWGYEQDAALGSVVAADLATNFVDGFRDRGFWSPLWFKTGLAHIAARNVDEKLAIYAFRAVRQHDTDAWKWEPRVLGLVSNDYAPKWSAMMELTAWEEITGALHMCLWSRTGWLLLQPEEQRKAWLIGISKPFYDLKGDELEQARRAHEREITAAAFGRTPEELDAAWRRWVSETYKR
ncbi:MAG: hypothetical protein JNL28_16080 [Planctomycetes bacterium]|nr:hypothetical protein [Planctomycetota bacterium]